MSLESKNFGSSLELKMDTETPIHKLKQQLHGEKCSALLEAYILTGCDETSKIGSEVPAMAILKILVLNI